MANQQATLEKIVAWAKRRGFVYPASEVYGGLANTYDYGPYGTQLKENLRMLWWKRFIQDREDNYGIDSSIILKADIWEASGHTAGFADVMVEDKVNHKRYRADHLIEEKLEKLEEKLRDPYYLLETFFHNRLKEGQKGGSFPGGVGYEALAGENKLQNLSNEDLEDLKSLFKSTDTEVALQNYQALLRAKVDGLTPEVMEELIIRFKIKSPDGNELTPPKRFNQLFQTEIGIVAGDKNKAYLRGEIAQGLFMNFKNIVDTMHPKLPFGIGQAGKAFRNEITPGKFTFRTLEFDLMEFEYFFDPTKTEWEPLFEYWKEEMYKFAMEVGLRKENLRWREHEDFERSFYSSRTEDLEYEFPWGSKEMWGLAYRSDYDLRNHQEKSGKDLRYGYADGTKITPHVIEPTFGLSRLLSVICFDAYTEEEVNGATRVVMKFSPQIAPVQVAIFPLQKDEQLVTKAHDLYDSLRSTFRAEFDNAGNIGKMYRRQDEIGTPFCVTVDFDTLNDQSVTVRDRDTMAQERIKIAELASYLQSKFNS